MNLPDLNIPQVDMTLINQGASMLGGGKFHRFSDEGLTWFFLLPPYNHRGQIGKPVFECFGLPGKKRWTGWETWKYINPAYVDGDPVASYLQQLAAAGHGDAADMMPKPRYYANGILYQTQKIDGTIEQFSSDPELRIFTMPITVWNGICGLWGQPGHENASHPAAALLFQVQRSGKGRKGTNYSISVQRDAALQPARYNLLEIFGQEKVMDIIQNKAPDLDETWPPPGDKEAVEAQDIIRGLKAKFSLGATPGTVTPGVQPGPVGSIQVGGPAAAPPSVAPAPSFVQPGSVPVTPQQPALPGTPENAPLTNQAPPGPVPTTTDGPPPAVATGQAAPLPMVPSAAPVPAGAILPDAPPATAILPAPAVDPALAAAAAAGGGVQPPAPPADPQ
jgi:hypothetical protein